MFTDTPVYRDKAIIKPIALALGVFLLAVAFIAVLRLFTTHTYGVSFVLGMSAGPFLHSQYRASRDAYRYRQQMARLAVNCSV
jgi:Flp pilus assembly protein TadB